LAFATFLVRRLRTGACGVGACGFWRYRMPPLTLNVMFRGGRCHKRQKAQAPTPQAPIRNRKTGKVANAKVHNRYKNPT